MAGPAKTVVSQGGHITCDDANEGNLKIKIISTCADRSGWRGLFKDRNRTWDGTKSGAGAGGECSFAQVQDAVPRPYVRLHPMKINL
jgi:hypothetical protein